eukprot:2721041-Amphidinium_carterae.1
MPVFFKRQISKQKHQKHILKAKADIRSEFLKDAEAERSSFETTSTAEGNRISNEKCPSQCVT